MGLGVNVLSLHSLLRSLLLCRKINMLDVTLVRVNINTPATGLGVSQGSAACGGGKDGDYSSTLTAAPTWHQYVRNSHSGCYVNPVWRIKPQTLWGPNGVSGPLVYSEQAVRMTIWRLLLGGLLLLWMLSSDSWCTSCVLGKKKITAVEKVDERATCQ